MFFSFSCKYSTFLSYSLNVFAFKGQSFQLPSIFLLQDEDENLFLF